MLQVREQVIQTVACTPGVDVSIKIDVSWSMPSRTAQTKAILPLVKAIADEKRLRILMLLADGERCVCDLQDELDAGQSLLSFHLKTLKDARLVTDRRDGRWAYYKLSTEGTAELQEFIVRMHEAASVSDTNPSRRCD